MLGSFLFIQANAQETSFSIAGEISGTTEKYIYLNYEDNDLYKTIKDSSLISQGKFAFKGKLSSITEGKLWIKDVVPVKLILMPTKLTLSIQSNDFKNAVLTGSTAHNSLKELQAARAPVMKEFILLREDYNNARERFGGAFYDTKDEKVLKPLKDAVSITSQRLMPLIRKIGSIDSVYLSKNSSTYAAAVLLHDKMNSTNVEQLKKGFDQLSTEVQQSDIGREMQAKIDGVKLGFPGTTASNFSSTDLNGVALSLSDYRGKYVLLDFWASWCVPCRAGNPHLISLYNKYKAKGFEIIGIADDDRNHGIWRRAIDEDKIGIWKHILNGFAGMSLAGEGKMPVGATYNISGLPTKILVNPDGKIIGRFGGGSDSEATMDKMLAELFGS